MFHLGDLNWKVINKEGWNVSNDEKNNKSAEVLVFNTVETKYISKIYINSMTLNDLQAKFEFFKNDTKNNVESDKEGWFNKFENQILSINDIIQGIKNEIKNIKINFNDLKNKKKNYQNY